MFSGRHIEWRRRPTEVKDGRIWVIKGFPEENYNVLDYSGASGEALYVTFASVDDSNPAEIRKFCDKYGLLGLIHSRRYQSRKNSEEYVMLLTNKERGSYSTINEDIPPDINDSLTVELIERMDEEENSESITDIQIEIIRMRAVLDTLDAMARKRDSSMLLSLTRAVCLGAKGYDHTRDDGTIQPEYEQFLFAKTNISEIISSYLGDISPVLRVDPDTRGFAGGWQVDNLLAAMYLMLFLELSKGGLIKHCENETCSNFFSVSIEKADKKYCSQSCARAQASRVYRRREKEK